MTAKDHNKLLAIFHLVQGGLQVFGGIIVALVYGALGLTFKANAQQPEQQFIGTVFIILAFVIAPFVFVLGGINLMAGYKMLKEKAGARTWGIVASIVSLLSVPLGTALGVYGLWFLFGDEGKRYYLGGAAHQYFNNPPPPNNWQ